MGVLFSHFFSYSTSLVASLHNVSPISTGGRNVTFFLFLSGEETWTTIIARGKEKCFHRFFHRYKLVLMHNNKVQ